MSNTKPTQPMTSLNDELGEILELYGGGVARHWATTLVFNRDTNFYSHDETLQQILDLIASETKKARIDELKRADKNAHKIGDYYKQRLRMIELVELENGATTYMFAPISVGDEVESYQNGEYLNWKRTKPQTQEQARADGQLVVVINMLKDIGQAVGAKFAMDTELSVKSETKIAREAEEDMDEPVDLSTIPF